MPAVDGGTRGLMAMAGDPILIVDDNPANLKLARVVLAGAGFEVRTAADAEEAFAAIDSFHLLLIDGPPAPGDGRL